MTQPTAKRGRPLTPETVHEERHCEIQAISYELAKHDAFELAAYETMDLALEQIIAHITDGFHDHALQDLHSTRRLLAEVRSRDLRENNKHRLIGTLAKTAVAS